MEENKLITLMVVELLIGIALTIGVYGILLKGNPVKLGYAGFNRIERDVTNSSVQLNPSTITEVLSKNTGRIYALICDDDSTNDAYLHLTNSTTSVAVSEGIKLSPGDCYEIGPDNLWIGKVYGIASATTTLTTVEK